MNLVNQILDKIEACIRDRHFVNLENEKIKLKDNSHDASDWNEVFITGCSFLNSEGGIIIIGVKEDKVNRQYIVTGFNQRNEEKAKTLAIVYSNDKGSKISLGDNIRYELRDFMDKQVLVIFIDALADDEKYIFFKGNAYERKITGDHKIEASKIESQNEYKAELVGMRELKVAPNARLADLDVNKLNDYIQLLNSEIKTENIKATIEDGVPFLTRNSMLRDGIPTILGILVCGARPGEKLQFASQVDAYVESVNRDIAQDKKIINDTVLQLMEQSVAFINRNIQTGISPDNAGTKTYEYPERLIRECVNNSIAHRDYTINQFVSISIVSGKHIQIRNPGRFKQQLLIHDLENAIPIRRIIAASKANNPKLAKVLSVYNKWEGKAYGMARLTSACLEDKIDLPYYIFHSPDELSLLIPKGRLMDETMETLFESYSGYVTTKLHGEPISSEQQRILAYVYKSELRNREDRYTILLTKDNNHLQAIQSLEEAGLIIRHRISNEIYPVFIIDRSLFKSNFRIELHNLFGDLYDTLDRDSKEVLAYIYERNTFALKKYPSANETGSKLWIKKGFANVVQGYEPYKRKVRKIIEKLTKNHLLLRYEGSYQYIVNTRFKEEPDLFSNK